MKKAAMLLAGLVLLAGCGSDNPTDPLAGFEPQVSNVVDNFGLQATDVTGVATVLQYTWENSGTQASVDHSTTTLVGAASVVIRDADGATVNDSTLQPSLNEDTASGSSGSWSISVVFSDYSGTVNFRVQKK